VCTLILNTSYVEVGDDHLPDRTIWSTLYWIFFAHWSIEHYDTS